MKYIGKPVDEKKLAASQWDPIGETFGKKIVDRREICFPLEIEWH
jgi:hypothetical protein